MRTGRPTEFDRQDALERAMVLFWRKGYEATGLADLTAEMGIGRQSLYNTFGDKHSLFVEAVKHYSNRNSQALIDRLSAPGSGLENIRQTFEGVVNFMTSGDCRGCLLTNSAIELAPHDEEVAQVVRTTMTRIERAFRVAVERAVEAGEITADVDPKAMARFLNNTLQGLVVLGKASTGKAVLRDVVQVTLSKLN